MIFLGADTNSGEGKKRVSLLAESLAAWRTYDQPPGRKGCGVVILIAVLLSPLPAASSGELRLDSCLLPPNTVGPVKAKLLIIDKSASILQGNRASRARAAVRLTISAAEPGTYLILATFGTRAQIVADRFLQTAKDRALLVERTESIVMDAPYTDVTTLEELIESVRRTIAARFAAQGIDLDVDIFTDAIPDPPRRRGGKSHAETFDLILGRRPTKSALGDGLFVLGLGFDQAAVGVTAAANPLATPTPLAHPTAPRTSTATGETPRNLRLRKSASVALVIALLLILIAVCLRRAFLPNLDMPEPSNRNLPTVLAVSEIDKSDGSNVALRKDEKIPIVPGTPVVFGTDPARCSYIARAIPGIKDIEFFRVVVTDQGTVRVTAVPGTQCQGRPVPKRGLAFSYRTPFQLRLATREWEIAVAEPDGESAAVDNLFTRLGSNSNPEDQLA